MVVICQIHASAALSPGRLWTLWVRD